MRTSPLLSIMAGFVLWAGLFVLLYGVQATGCHLAGNGASALAGTHPTLRWALMILAAFGITAVALLCWNKRAGRRAAEKPDETTEFTREVSRYVWLGAAVATPFTFFGVAFLRLCGT